jgi:hypothetical protein
MEPAGSLIGARNDIKVDVTHDIRGYSDRIGAIRSAAVTTERPHHPSALYYTTKYNLEAIKRPTMADWYRFNRSPGVFNTTTHQGAQRIADRELKFSLYIRSHDPYGDATGPGSRKYRESAYPGHYPENKYMSENAIAF